MGYLAFLFRRLLSSSDVGCLYRLFFLLFQEGVPLHSSGMHSSKVGKGPSLRGGIVKSNLQSLSRTVHLAVVKLLPSLPRLRYLAQQ
jgi:hypothetical protein